MSQFTFTDHIASFENYIDLYFKNKSRDCILYSKDGSKFKVHKELFGQTNFLRKILSSTNERCCGTIEVFCPCSKDELNHLVNFLYDGEIHCEEEFDSLKILENLNKIFGFSKHLAMKMPNNSISEVFPILIVTELVAITEETFENMSSENERIHTAENLYSCKTCNKCFNQLSTLKRHELFHTDEKSYSCRYCSKVFKDLSNKKKHQLTHSGEKPYSCTYCSKTFSQKVHKGSHERIHTGEKPYFCKTCNKSFRRRDNLKIHKLIHSDGKPYSCRYCSKFFRHLSSMKRHELTHSGEK